MKSIKLYSTKIVKLLSIMIIFLTVIVSVSSCGSSKDRKELKILMRMMPLQHDYYAKEVIPEFEKKFNAKVTLVNFEESWKIEDILKLEKNKSEDDRIGVVKVPFEMTRTLARKGFVKPMMLSYDSSFVKMHKGEYYPLALSLGTIDDNLYYLPRKLETRILVYLKSKVEDAVENWKMYEDELNTVLKPQNGFGLPKDYNLDSDPSNWDFYDVFVVGYYWANQEYMGVKMPRIAHRSARYEGTSLGLMEMAYRLGASHDDVIDVVDTKVEDAFLWEAAYVKNGIYNPSMWQDLWTGSGIWNGFKDGKVFMAEMQQIDCFFLHGWPDNPQMPGYVKDPDDLHFAMVPKGVSFELNQDGEPLYQGNKKATTGGWWWGIPSTASDTELGYEFIRFATSREIQAQEISKFGILPVRKDLVFKLPAVFNQGFVGDVFKVSSQQLRENEDTFAPLIEDYPKLAQEYINIWYDIVIDNYANDKNVPVSSNEISTRIKNKFGEALKKITKM